MAFWIWRARARAARAWAAVTVGWVRVWMEWRKDSSSRRRGSAGGMLGLCMPRVGSSRVGVGITAAGGMGVNGEASGPGVCTFFGA